jgi:hypothetical protein
MSITEDAARAVAEDHDAYPTSWAGQVSSVGGKNKGPAAWSTSTTGTGVYRITHSLGHTNYTGFASVEATGDLTATVQTSNANYMDIYVRSAGTLSNQITNFLIQLT